MSIVVDTPVWSLSLRRHPKSINDREKQQVRTLEQFIEDGNVRLIGPIRQELLSGIRERNQFDRLKEHLGAFRDEPLRTSDYELAADFSNQCRRAGIAGSSIDFLICATAVARNWSIYTNDGDFLHYGKVLPIRIYHSESA